MNKTEYKIPEEKIGVEDLLDLVLKESSAKYGLQEFSDKILKKVNAFEKEDNKIYVRCLKREKEIIVYDKSKKRGKPEEVK